VQTQNSVGILSSVSSGTVTIVGKDQPPSNVPNITLTQSGEYIIVVITPPNDPDINFYELRMGSSWSNSILIDKFTATKYTILAPEEGTLTYWIKAVDNFGNYSVNATKATINIFGFPKKNVIFERTEDINNWVVNECYYTKSNGWKLDTKGLNLSDYQKDLINKMNNLPADLRQKLYNLDRDHAGHENLAKLCEGLKDKDPDFNMKSEMDIMMLNTDEANEFIIQMDTKTHFKKAQIVRINKASETNYMIDQLNKNREYNLHDTIDNKMKVYLNELMTSLFNVSSNIR
jgi:hypothetical protein